MDALRYHQLLNTITLEEFAPNAYRFYVVLDGVIVEGIYIMDHGFFALSEESKHSMDIMDLMVKVIQEKIKEQKEKE